ncbi:MAG: carboxypeptidase regulatory-like domain-containing protein [Candidatus Brocadia sinica]|nr:carboxypeptidase regulatory-like domain-containing protein [Candidatus Brocadia sinica]NUO03933.1 carboxypeptidase regulatory-like domain-containing protein [Candidatus Brocadia sinica]
MFSLNKLFMPLGIVVGLFSGAYLPDMGISALQAASIVGVISDENGDPIEDALIMIKSKKNTSGKKSKKTVSTDSEGVYEIDNVKKGKYKLTVKSKGYETVTEVLTTTNNSEEVERDFVLTFSTYTKTSDTKTMDAAVASYNEIGVLRKQVPIDGDAIASAYEGELQDLTKEVDAENTLTLDSDILAAIEDIKNNNEPDLAVQVIDKTLQRLFYLAILERITDVRDDFHDGKKSDLKFLWDEAYAAYQAIAGTADRENKVITEDRTSIETGSNPNLEDRITIAFVRGQDALDRKDHDEDEITVGVQRQVIRLSLVRAFYIAVLREVEGVLNNRDSDQEKALVYQKEGEVYYRIIEEFVSRDNPEGNEIIKSQLTGDLADVNADTLVSELSKGFIGRVRGELESNESALNANDRGDAMVTAEEALLYSEVFLEDLELRLGADDSEEIEDVLYELKDASDEVNKENADTASQTISTILDSYENVLL